VNDNDDLAVLGDRLVLLLCLIVMMLYACGGIGP
jgi:hypothetical protein